MTETTSSGSSGSVPATSIEDGETDFDRFYERQIHPWLETEEVRRQALVSRYWRVLVPIIAGAVALFFALMFVVPSIVEIWPFYLAIAAMVALGSGYPLYQWSDKFNSELATQVFGHFDYAYSPTAPREILVAFSRVGILPSYNRETCTDHVSGKVEDVPFEIIEAHLIHRSRNRKNETTDTTVFRGLLARFDFPKPFKARTLVLADRGAIFNALGGLFGSDERVRLEDPRFEKAFEVYSPDQIEARYLLTPAFMERLLSLKARVDCSLCAAFDQGQLWLAIDGRREYFPRFSVWRDLRRADQIRGLLRDINLISDIARLLRLDGETRV